MLKYYTLLKNSDLCKKIINFKYLQTKDFRILKAIKHYKVGNNYIEHENVTKLANYILDTYDPSELEELFDINTVCITLYYNLYGKNFRIIIDDVDQIKFSFYTKEEFKRFSKLGGTKNDILSVSVEYIEREESENKEESEDKEEEEKSENKEEENEEKEDIENKEEERRKRRY